jgi:hypothetical protein
MWRTVVGAFFAALVPVVEGFVVLMRGKETSSSSSVPVSSPKRFCCGRPCRRRVSEGRRIFCAVLARNQLGCVWVGLSSASLSKPSRALKSSGSEVWSFGERGVSPWYRGMLSADLLADRFSRDSSRVPKRAVFRNEPRRRRVRRCCCKTADIALALAGASLRACGLLDPRSSLASSCSMASDRVTWLMRRKDSFESKEPDRLRLWPLLVLPDRVRLDGLSTANSALLLWPSSISAGGTPRAKTSARHSVPQHGNSGPDENSL